MNLGDDVLAYPVYEFRPLGIYPDLERWDEVNQKWIPDDGEWGIYFASKQEQVHWHIFMPYHVPFGWQWCDEDQWARNASLKYPKHPRGNAWHYEVNWDWKRTEWKQRYLHPNEAVTKNRPSQCGNGWGPDLFHIHDPYIQKGLVRRQDTKEVLVPPTKCYCALCDKTLKVI